MKNVLLYLSLFLTYAGFSQHWDWVKQLANTGNNEIRFATSVNGNNYLSASPQSFYNVSNCHLLRINGNGNNVWDKNLGNDIQIKGLASNNSGCIFLAGNFKDTIIINGTMLISGGKTDAFLFKFDSLGQTVWLKTFSGSNDDVCNDININATGNIFITGALSSNAVVEGNSYPTKGLFICKFDSMGTLLQIVRSTTGGQGLLIRSDSLNNMYILGTVQTDTLLLDTVVVYPPYYYNANNFVAKFNINGNYNGFLVVGNGNNLALEQSGNFYISENGSSYYSSSILKYYNSSFFKVWQKNNPGSVNSISLNSKKNEVYLAGSNFNYSDSTISFLWKYDRDGNLLDEVLTKPHQQVTGSLVQHDEQENLYLIGNSYGTSDFGNIHVVMNNSQSYFLAKIKGKKPYAGFMFSQPYEVQSIYFKNRCFSDTSLKWIFPNGIPAESYEKDPVVTYTASGVQTASLIAYNEFSSDTMIQQIIVRSEPTDTIFTKLFDYASWGCCASKFYTETSDGGFLVGWPRLYKFNNRGSLEWKSSTTFGSFPGDITEVKDGYIALSSSMTLLDNNGALQAPQVIKTDLKGKLMWLKNYTDQYWGGSISPFGVSATHDGGFVFGGPAVVKCDSMGNIVWQKRYPPANGDVLNHTNGKYIISLNSYIAQINEDGSFNWIKGLNISSAFNIAIVCANKDILISGTVGSMNNQESYVFRLDSMANVKWAKTYKAGECWITNLAEIGENKIMMTANYGGTSGNRQFVLMLIDNNGNLEWNRATSVSDMSMSLGIVANGDKHAFCFGSKNQYNFVSRVGITPPACFTDSIEIICSSILVSTSSSTTIIGNMHYAATDVSFNQSFLQMPLIPTIQCNGSGGLVTATENITKKDKEGIYIFPNPSCGIFTIRLNSQSEARITVSSLVGNCIYNKVVKNNLNNSIDLTNQPKGIYFMEIVSDGERVVKKIVLQ